MLLKFRMPCNKSLHHLQERQLQEADQKGEVEQKLQAQNEAEQLFLEEYVQTLHSHQQQLQEVIEEDSASLATQKSK